MTEQELAQLAKQHGVTPQALLAALSVVAKTNVDDKVTSQHPYRYYLVQVDRFETVVQADATLPRLSNELAFEHAIEPLQPWYFVKQPKGSIIDYNARLLTHNEYCDWLRSE